MSVFKTRLGRRRLIGAAIFYVGLWGVTQLIGTGPVRAIVAERNLPGADCPRLRSCECDAVAVAPLLVKAAYFWDSGTLAGGGAKLLYVWLGPLRLQVWEWDVIAI